jgi:N-acylneuraminate cytidylyltransferase
MKNLVIVPIKAYSERIPGKNFVKIMGVPLYQIFLTTLCEAKVFDGIVVDTDSTEITRWCQKMGMITIPRLAELASDKANGNTLLRYHVQKFPGVDIYWQGFVTAPYISVNSVKGMYATINQLSTIQSIMSCKVLRGHFWSHDGKPINHRPDAMPRTQDTPLIYQEVCGLFGIKAEAFNVTRTRSAEQPFFYALPDAETKDIDWPEDLKGK